MKNIFKNIIRDQFHATENHNSEEYKTRFHNYVNSVEYNNREYDKVESSKYLLSIIIEHLNFSEAIKSIESTNHNLDNSFIELIYHSIENNLSLKHSSIITDRVHEDDKVFYKGEEIHPEGPLKVKINELPILVNPWNGDRVLDNMFTINSDNIFDGASYSWNIQNIYLYPMDIVVCQGGNHSQFAARIKNQGKTLIKEVRNYSNLYNEIYFDGYDFRKKINKSVIELEYSREQVFYSGVIFELGRYILDDKYHTFSLTKNS